MIFNKLGGLEAAESFWQLLIVCSGQDFIQFGEDLIGSLEVNSPDVRLLVYISDDDAAARELLRLTASRLYGLSLYGLEAGSPTRSNAKSFRYKIAKEVLLQTQLPTLTLDASSFIRRDLTLLPAELQKADCALTLRFDRESIHEKALPSTMWLQPNARVDRFLSHAIFEMADTISENVERESVYRALQTCRGFLKVAALPARYADLGHEQEGFIWSGPQHGKTENSQAASFREKTRARFAQAPEAIVLFPKQDLGTKKNLENNTFKRRVERLVRPGRMAWRHMARLLVELSWEKGSPARLVPLPQWKITTETLQRYSFARSIFIPHQISTQMPHPNAHYYMQELIPALFTVDRNGWGGASSLYSSQAFRHAEVDPRLADFIHSVQKNRVTKAPQKVHSEEVVDFDILAPLQVPGDDALLYHSDVSIEQFVESLSNFAELSDVKVMFRPHPFDKTDLFEVLQKKFASKLVIFSRKGHIHDCLMKAKCVAVINSGVGFEAMLFNKPVITFGRAIYDSAVFKADLGEIHKSYRPATAESPSDRWARYERFISNYIYKVGFKIDEPTLNKCNERSASPCPGPNPIYADFSLEAKLQRSGTELIKPPRGAMTLRLKSEAAVALQRLRKITTMSLKRYMKRYTAPIWRRAKKRLTSPLHADVFAGKTVALVGNAASLSAGTRGDEIDNHDIVIRMNLGYPLAVRKDMRGHQVPSEYTEGYFVDGKSSGREKLSIINKRLTDDVLNVYTSVQALGKKTSIWSCSTSDRSRQLFFAPLFDCITVACHPALEHISMRLLLSRRIKRFETKIYDDLVLKYKIEPTSGLLWIDYLRRTNLKKLDIYGFDFFSSGHIARATPNVLEVRGKWPHAPDVEEQYVSLLLASDRRVSLIQPF
ncbi:glycosyl transferase family 29 (putative sialyltransferase) [Rhizobium azibense]|nr:glycosyl transferase family 29 (putative sialyltransferase) [Rhizobium azibense]